MAVHASGRSRNKGPDFRASSPGQGSCRSRRRLQNGSPYRLGRAAGAASEPYPRPPDCGNGRRRGNGQIAARDAPIPNADWKISAIIRISRATRFRAAMPITRWRAPILFTHYLCCAPESAVFAVFAWQRFNAETVPIFPSGDVVVQTLESLREVGHSFGLHSRVRDFLLVASSTRLKPKVTPFRLNQVNDALLAVKEDPIDGAAMVIPRGDRISAIRREPAVSLTCLLQRQKWPLHLETCRQTV